MVPWQIWAFKVISVYNLQYLEIYIPKWVLPVVLDL